MKPIAWTTSDHHPARRAFSLAEAVVSIFIVGVVLVAALNTVGASGWSLHKLGDRARGSLLAQQLMTVRSF